MGRGRALTIMRQEQEGGRATGLAGHDQTARRGKTGASGFGDDGGHRPGPYALLGRHQSFHGGGDIDKDKARRIEPECCGPQTRHPPLIHDQGALADPQPDAGPGGFQSRKRKSRRCAGIAIGGFGNFMHALARQSEGEGGGRGIVAQPGSGPHEALKTSLIDHMFYFCSRTEKSQ